MKKIIGLVVALMTIVNLSVSAQQVCGTTDNGFTVPRAWTTPTLYGDFTPCRNQKNVVYTIGNVNPALPISWTWCRGIPGVLPSAGFVPTQFRWSVDPNSGAKITDGITTSNTAGLLYTTQLSVAVSYKTKGTWLGVYFKDSCNTWQSLGGYGPVGGRTITLTCDPGTGQYPYVAPVTPDTGKTLINADINHATYNMYLDFDSISGLAGPHTYINVYKKSPTSTCNSNGATWFSDGYYTQTRQTASPSLPFNVAYGWSLYFASATTPPATFRVTGTSANGTSWVSLPFTVTTTVPSNINYPTLP